MNIRLIYLEVLVASYGLLCKANINFSTSSSSSVSTASSQSASISFSAGDDWPNTTTTTNNTTSTNGTTVVKDSSRTVSGYYPTYSYHLTPLSEVNYEVYDELLFFSATTNNNFTIATGELNQTEWDSLAHEFVARCKNASVTPTLSFGGWIGGLHFSDLMATAENRTAYASSVVEFTKKYDFEGIHFDWEWPSLQGIGCNSVRDEDLENFASLLVELKSIWPDVLISAASSVAGWRDSSYAAVSSDRLTGLIKHLHKVYVMAYDVHGGWSTTTGPNAPFTDTCADDANKLSVKGAFDIYLKQGFNASQLVMGVPTYGRSWTLADPTLVPRTVGNYTSYYYQNFTSIPPGGAADDKPGVDVCGQETGWGGTWMVKELVQNGFLSAAEDRGLNGYTLYQDECSGVPFLASNETLISYDDTKSSVLKASWAKENKLGGIFFFNVIASLDQTIVAARTEFLKH